MRAITRPKLEEMSEEDYAVLLTQPRVCHGPCREVKTFADFDQTWERGRRVFRTACHQCMLSYYRAVSSQARTRLAIASLIASDGPLDTEAICQRLTLPRRLVERALQHEWFERELGRWHVSNAARAAIVAKAEQGGAAAKEKFP